ncbi:MAG: trypsin-like peptidase domain-containing protein [Deltaproteobacteria bacterium]|nr:trypsin-like peptidase domain-containing protein [Deltaproteobacteria bacterium]
MSPTPLSNTLSALQSTGPAASFPLSREVLTALPVNSQIARLEQGIVQIVFESAERQHFGSGVIINERGHVLTALHVLEPDPAVPWQAPYALVSTGAGPVKLPIRILKVSPSEDLALVALPEQRTYRAISILDRNIESGETLFSLGFPKGVKEISVGQALFPSTDPEVLETFATFRSKWETLNYRCAILLVDVLGGHVQNGNVVSTNQIEHGSSGGAMLSADGRLAGLVVSFKSRMREFQEDLREVSSVDLGDYNFPERVAVSRSTAQLRSFITSR